MWHLLEGRHSFKCEYPKVRRLLEGGAYLRPGAYYRKYGNNTIMLNNRKRNNYHLCGRIVVYTRKFIRQYILMRATHEKYRSFPVNTSELVFLLIS